MMRGYKCFHKSLLTGGPTLAEGYLPQMGDTYPGTYLGQGVPTLDGRYLHWMVESILDRGYLPWTGVPRLDRGYLPQMGVPILYGGS